MTTQKNYKKLKRIFDLLATLSLLAFILSFAVEFSFTATSSFISFESQNEILSSVLFVTFVVCASLNVMYHRLDKRAKKHA